MKKVITIIFLIFTVSFASAQDQDKDVIKQSDGDKSLELQLDPGSIFNASNSNTILSNSLGIRFRLFASKNQPFRINLNVTYDNTNTITQDKDEGANLEELRDKEANLGFLLRPGIEKHFKASKRLSPYVGAEFIFGYHTGKIKSDYQAGTNVYVLTSKNLNPDNGLTIGAAIVAGTDYYIAKKIYLGVELGYSFSYFMPFKTKITDSAPNTLDIETKTGKFNTMIIEPQILNVLRIGFLF